MLLVISTATVRKTIVLSENGILRPLRFARSDVTPRDHFRFASSAKKNEVHTSFRLPGESVRK